MKLQHSLPRKLFKIGNDSEIIVQIFLLVLTRLWDCCHCPWIQRFENWKHVYVNVWNTIHPIIFVRPLVNPQMAALTSTSTPIFFYSLPLLLGRRYFSCYYPKPLGVFAAGAKYSRHCTCPLPSLSLSKAPGNIILSRLFIRCSAFRITHASFYFHGISFVLQALRDRHSERLLKHLKTSMVRWCRFANERLRVFSVVFYNPLSPSAIHTRVRFGLV